MRLCQAETSGTRSYALGTRQKRTTYVQVKRKSEDDEENEHDRVHYYAEYNG